MSLRTTATSKLIKRHIRLKREIEELDKRRNELASEKQNIYSHLYNKGDGSRGLQGSFHCLIDGVRVYVTIMNGSIFVKEPDFIDVDTISPADDEAQDSQ